MEWPKEAIAKELIERVKQPRWWWRWNAEATARQLAGLLQSALDRIEELGG